MTNEHLTPKTVKPSYVRQPYAQRRHNCKRSYNRHAKPLRPLQKGDRVHHRDGKTWEPAIVVDNPAPRSYNIKPEHGSTFHQNRRHSSLNMPVFENESENAFSETMNTHAERADPNLPSEPNGSASDRQQARDYIPDSYTTRSGRVPRAPDRLTYY